MPRPLPAHPRGPRRRSHRRETYVLACPRVSPEYELNAVQALMKPSERTKGKVEHVAGQQAWPSDAAAAVNRVVADVSSRLGYRPEPHWPEGGDYWFVIGVSHAQLEEAKGLAVAISRALPGVWITLGRVMLNGGNFYRRQFGYKLRLVPATNVHLRREIRGALKGLV